MMGDGIERKSRKGKKIAIKRMRIKLDIKLNGIKCLGMKFKKIKLKKHQNKRKEQLRELRLKLIWIQTRGHNWFLKEITRKSRQGERKRKGKKKAHRSSTASLLLTHARPPWKGHCVASNIIVNGDISPPGGGARAIQIAWGPPTR